jgi:hypothetical protein
MSLEEQKSKINTHAASSGLCTVSNAGGRGGGGGGKEYVVCVGKLPREERKELYVGLV